MKKINYLILLVAILLLTACSVKEQIVSEGMETVIEAMFTCPNDTLYDESYFAIIGEGTENNKESTEQSANILYENWYEKVGKYFTERGFDKFWESGLATMFLSQADMEDAEIEIKETVIEEQGDTFTKLKVFYLKNDREEYAVLLFKLDSEGLIEKIELV